jgi:hypothetical protein
VAIARWKDLCIDAVDAARIAEFWGASLGLEVEHQAGGDAVLRGVRPTETIWVNAVPEPRTVKQRVHLDVEAASVEPFIALGASMQLSCDESGFPWSVLVDPEGGEFCVFVRDDHPTDPPGQRFELVVDTTDSASSQALATWWADVLGARVADDGRGFWWVADVPGLPFETIDFVPVPEPKTVKNRVHWDVESDQLSTLIDRGATVLAPSNESTPWHVSADPAGNEFCVFALR